MDDEFHYYITALAALRAGLNKNDAYIIAYASQYTDDNETIFDIAPGTPDAYRNYISQTMNILKPGKELMRIYPIFHFMPGDSEDILGDSSRRCDGKLHLLNTTPANRNASRLLRAALASRNLYRIGIASHTFADTFAHQNFVGYYDAYNGMKGLLDGIKPDIGHADAEHHPDWPAHRWKDSRLIASHAVIDNKKRVLAAAGHLFDHYYAYGNGTDAGSAQKRGDFIDEIDTAIGTYDLTNEKRDRRIGRYRILLGSDLAEYDRHAWLNAAVKKSVGLFQWDYSWKENYQESHWLKFQEAVKAQQWLVKDEILKPIFDTMELKNL